MLRLHPAMALQKHAPRGVLRILAILAAFQAGCAPPLPTLTKAETAQLLSQGSVNLDPDRLLALGGCVCVFDSYQNASTSKGRVSRHHRGSCSVDPVPPPKPLSDRYVAITITGEDRRSRVLVIDREPPFSALATLYSGCQSGSAARLVLSSPNGTATPVVTN